MHELLQSCLTLCDSTDCGPSGSSVHGIFQARILEWVALPFSRGSSRPWDRTCTSYVSYSGRWVFFTTSATWGAPPLTEYSCKRKKKNPDFQQLLWTLTTLFLFPQRNPFCRAPPVAFGLHALPCWPGSPSLHTQCRRDPRHSPHGLCPGRSSRWWPFINTAPLCPAL